MPVYIHSNLLGTFVFDESFNLIEKAECKDINQDFLDWSDTEKKLIKKYSKEKPLYIGFKNEKLDNIKLTQDETKVEKLSNFFKKSINDFFKPNLILTKQSVKASVNEDLFIIHAITNIEELDKSNNILSKRLREWYELYLPEFSKSLGDNETFARLITEKGKTELLKEIKLKESESMGADLSDKDIEPILNLAKCILENFRLRKLHENYLEELMKSYCPNIQAIAGTMIGGKLLAGAGSLQKMVLFPASTIQLLGAEKALFRHIRTGSRPPKYGLLINHPIVTKLSSKDKGKGARALADKISIASKIDFYKGNFLGDKLREELEKKFKHEK